MASRRSWSCRRRACARGPPGAVATGGRVARTLPRGAANADDAAPRRTGNGRSIAERHPLADARVSYDDAQALFHHHLPREAPLFNQYHALLVETGKRWCRAREARCEECPLGRFLERAP